MLLSLQRLAAGFAACWNKVMLPGTGLDKRCSPTTTAVHRRAAHPMRTSLGTPLGACNGPTAALRMSCHSPLPQFSYQSLRSTIEALGLW